MQRTTDELAECRVISRIAAHLEPFPPERRMKILSALVTTYGAEAEVIRAYERDRKSSYRMSRTMGLDVPDIPHRHNGHGNGRVSGTTDAAVPDPIDVLCTSPAVPLPEVPVSEETRKLQLRGQAVDLLHHLNQKTGQHFRLADTHLTLIIARLRSGVSFADARAVIDLKTHEWLGTDQEKYLRPETLFGARKFEQYLGRISVAMPPAISLDAPLAWAEPGALIQQWNEQAPGDDARGKGCTAVESVDAALLALEREALTWQPAESWWAEAFAEMNASKRKLLARCPTTEGGLGVICTVDKFLSPGDGTRRRLAARVHDGELRDG